MRQISWSNVVKCRQMSSSSRQGFRTAPICWNSPFSLTGPLRQSHCLFQDFRQGRTGRTRKNKFQGTVHCPKQNLYKGSVEGFRVCFEVLNLEQARHGHAGFAGRLERNKSVLNVFILCSFMFILWKGKLHEEVNILIFDFRACRPHF